MPVARALLNGSPYLGVYVRLSPGGALLPPSAPATFEREIERLFGLRSVRLTVGESELIGALVAMNSRGAVLSDEADPQEARAIEPLVPATRIRSRHNALGNNVLANDHGALVHPDLSDEAIGHIHRTLGVPVHRGTVAGLPTVGMAAVATNRGVVAHPKVTAHEAGVLEQVLGVPLARSTANFGIPVVGACLVATERSILTGRPTTPVEIVHLQDGLKVYD